MYKTVYTEVEVELGDFDTEDLLEELENRNALPCEHNDHVKQLLEQIWHLRRLGKSYDHLVDLLIYQALGKII